MVGVMSPGSAGKQGRAEAARLDVTKCAGQATGSLAGVLD